MVEIKDLQKQELKDSAISIKTFPSYTKWMKDNGVSPSRLLNKTIEELMEKQKENNTQ